MLVRSLPVPEWNEWYVVLYMVGLALEKLREVRDACFYECLCCICSMQGVPDPYPWHKRHLTKFEFHYV